MELPSGIDFESPDNAAIALSIRKANDSLAGTAELVTVCSHLSKSWFRRSPGCKKPTTQVAVLRGLLLETNIPEDIRNEIVAAFIRDIQLEKQSQHDHETFIKFPDLPTELRIKIWEFAISSRVLVDPKAAANRTGAKSSLNRYLPVPHLAHVCQEARDTVFRNSSRNLSAAPISDKFNDLVLSTDILDLRNSEMCSVIAQPSPYLSILPLFRRLAFNLNGLSWDLRSMSLSDLEKSPSLTVITQTVVLHLPSHRSKEFPKSRQSHINLATKWAPGVREVDPEDIPFWHTWRTTEQFPSIGEKHITKIVSLDDRGTLQDLLSLGESRWTCGQARYNAVCRQATVFCMDCRQAWWNKRDRTVAEYRLLSGLFDNESPTYDKDSIFPGRWKYDLNRDHEWVQGMLAMLPKLQPAVRFIVGFDNYFPDVDYWANLRQRYA